MARTIGTGWTLLRIYVRNPPFLLRKRKIQINYLDKMK